MTIDMICAAVNKVLLVPPVPVSVARKKREFEQQYTMMHERLNAPQMGKKKRR